MHSVWIDWGDDDPDKVVRYDFKTLDELNAFLQGLEEASAQWHIDDFTQYDSQEDVDRHFSVN